MKRINLFIAMLLCMSFMAVAQDKGNCTYVPTLDTPLHSLQRRLSITFDDYKSVSFTNKESAVIYGYLTSLEKKHGDNSNSAMKYYAYSEDMKVSGNTLTFSPNAYRPSSAATQSAQRALANKAWGTDTQDYLRVAIPKGMLKAVDQEGKEVLLDSISYKYVYTEEDTPDDSDPMEYVLTPANGETVSTLSVFTLEFPNNKGIFTLNYNQPKNPYVMDDKGEIVQTATRMFDADAKNTGLIALKSSITKAGTYTLVIPSASYHMSPTEEAWEDSIRHPEIRATYRVTGTERRTWNSVPANEGTVNAFTGIQISFVNKTIVSKNPNVGGGELKVFDKSDDKYPAMAFQYYFAKENGNTITFTNASQVKKVKDKTTYYLDLPYGLLTFSDGTKNDGLHIEFTYDTDYVEPPTYVEGDNYVGYTTGAVQRKNGVRFNSGAEQGMLIYLPKEKTANLVGCTIKAIRTATGTTQIDSPRLVIIEGDDVNQTPVVEQTTSKFSTSMKDYALDKPYTITGRSSLYVGFKCSLSADYHPMLFDETLDLPAGLAWALTDKGWEDISCQGYGAPNIQILLDKNAKGVDLMVKPFQTSTYNKVGDKMTISTQVFNFGVEEVREFDIVYKIGNGRDVRETIRNINLPQGCARDITIDNADITDSGRLPLSVEVSNINGLEDIAPSDNRQSSSAYIYPADMSKKILFEEFTGQGCINCPSGSATVNRVLADYEDQYVEVYHHSGYSDDNFTTREDYEYTWFYGGRTYAPGGMANRHAAMPSLLTPVVQSNDMASVQAVVQSAMQMAPCVGIGMQNEYDNDTRQGKVTVDVTCYEVPSDLEHRLNVWLVQDSIMRYQDGSGVIKHNNVFRMSLTGVWGKAITLTEGDNQSLTFEYTIPQTIVGEYATNVLGGDAVEDIDDKNVRAVPNNMRIVAFVSDTSENPLNCTVWNAEECIVTDVPDGIKEITMQPAASNVIYDLQGRVVKNPRHGLYITNGKTFLKR